MIGTRTAPVRAESPCWTTRRCETGCESPSVRTPTIDEKIDILQRMDALGIDTAKHPACRLPDRRSPPTSSVWRGRLASSVCRIGPNCAARTVTADIRPIAEISQRAGIAIEMLRIHRGRSPIRRHTAGWTLEFLQKTTEDAIRVAPLAKG